MTRQTSAPTTRARMTTVTAALAVLVGAAACGPDATRPDPADTSVESLAGQSDSLEPLNLSDEAGPQSAPLARAGAGRTGPGG
jgi:hypothetical protein